MRSPGTSSNSSRSGTAPPTGRSVQAPRVSKLTGRVEMAWVTDTDPHPPPPFFEAAAPKIFWVARRTRDNPSTIGPSLSGFLRYERIDRVGMASGSFDPLLQRTYL